MVNIIMKMKIVTKNGFTFEINDENNENNENNENSEKEVLNKTLKFIEEGNLDIEYLKNNFNDDEITEIYNFSLNNGIEFVYEVISELCTSEINIVDI